MDDLRTRISHRSAGLCYMVSSLHILTDNVRGVQGKIHVDFYFPFSFFVRSMKIEREVEHECTRVLIID